MISRSNCFLKVSWPFPNLKKKKKLKWLRKMSLRMRVEVKMKQIRKIKLKQNNTKRSKIDSKRANSVNPPRLGVAGSWL